MWECQFCGLKDSKEDKHCVWCNNFKLEKDEEKFIDKIDEGEITEENFKEKLLNKKDWGDGLDHFH